MPVAVNQTPIVDVFVAALIALPFCVHFSSYSYSYSSLLHILLHILLIFFSIPSPIFLLLSLVNYFPSNVFLSSFIFFS